MSYQLQTAIHPTNQLLLQFWHGVMLQGCRKPNSLYCAKFDMSESGWSESIIFMEYIGEHFLHFAARCQNGPKLVLLYDRHKSRITPFLLTGSNGVVHKFRLAPFYWLGPMALFLSCLPTPATSYNRWMWVALCHSQKYTPSQARNITGNTWVQCPDLVFASLACRTFISKQPSVSFQERRHLSL